MLFENRGDSVISNPCSRNFEPQRDFGIEHNLYRITVILHLQVQFAPGLIEDEAHFRRTGSDVSAT